MSIEWVQITATVDRNEIEALEDAMMAAGAASVTLQDAQDQAILEPGIGETPLWDKAVVIALFDASLDLAEAREIISEVFTLQTELPAPSFKTEVLENEDWTRKWMENFKPIQFGKRLWICPSWEQTPDPKAVNVLLDPGLAFGTGTHPTTALCLKWLDGIELEGKTVVDYGCGSGILAIAALKLGAASAVCIDNDPQALIATLDNAERNDIPYEHIKTYLPDEKPELRADIVLANILAQPLIELSEDILSHLKPGGQLALSGILKEQHTQLREHYQARVELKDTAFLENWARINGSLRETNKE